MPGFDWRPSEYRIGGPLDMPNAPAKPVVHEVYEGWPITFEDGEGFSWEYGDVFATPDEARAEIDRYILAERIAAYEDGPAEPTMPWEETTL